MDDVRKSADTSIEDENEAKRSEAKRAMKSLFLKGLPIEEPGAKLTTSLKQILNKRLGRVDDYVYGSQNGD